MASRWPGRSCWDRFEHGSGGEGQRSGFRGGGGNLRFSGSGFLARGAWVAVMLVFWCYAVKTFLNAQLADGPTDDYFE